MNSRSARVISSSFIQFISLLLLQVFINSFHPSIYLHLVYFFSTISLTSPICDFSVSPEHKRSNSGSSIIEYYTKSPLGVQTNHKFEPIRNNQTQYHNPVLLFLAPMKPVVALSFHSKQPKFDSKCIDNGPLH